jgi:hypothetical protein
MNLPPALQQEIEQMAIRQGISPEQFIWQAVTEKINTLNEQATALADTALSSSAADPLLREQDGILVFDTESLDHIDFNWLLEQNRGRTWEQLGL